MVLLAFGMLLASAFFGASMLAEVGDEARQEREARYAQKSDEEKARDDEFVRQLNNHLKSNYQKDGHYGLIGGTFASIDALYQTYHYVKDNHDDEN